MARRGLMLREPLFLTTCIVFMFVVGKVDARIGATRTELGATYGPPITQEATPASWSRHGVRRVYSRNGFRIVTDSITSSGPVMRIAYEKENGESIQPDEAILLLKENAARGCVWKSDGLFFSHPTYRRSDGTTALLLNLPCKQTLIIRSPSYTRQAETSLKKRLAAVRQSAATRVACR